MDDKKYVVARFLAPVLSVSPPTSSYSYNVTLMLPPISAVLGALIGALDRIEPKGLLVTVGYKEPSKGVSLSYKSWYETLAEWDLSIGVAPMEGVKYTRSGVLRKIQKLLQMDAKSEEVKSDALIREYAFVHEFLVGVGVVSDKIDMIKEALRYITRLGDTESLVTFTEIYDARLSESNEGYGILPLSAVKNPSRAVIDRMSLLGDEDYELFAVSLVPARRRGVSVYIPNKLETKETKNIETIEFNIEGKELKMHLVKLADTLRKKARGKSRSRRKR